MRNLSQKNNGFMLEIWITIDHFLTQISASREKINRPVHALSCIMGNQGKFTKKKSRKTNIYLYISVLISHLKTKHIL